MPPADVKDKNEEEVRLSTYFAEQGTESKPSMKLKPFRFKIEEYVRISHVRTVFTRAYKETYTGEIFRVKKPVTIEGYYPPIDSVTCKKTISRERFMNQSCRVDVELEQLWTVENVLKTRGKGRNKQYFVKWKYYPDKFDSWVNDIQ